MDIAIAPYVAETRTLYCELAEQENVSLATIVEKQYRELPKMPALAQLESHATRGNLPETLCVDAWTPEAARLMLAIATVVLAVELSLAA
jgi:hypothetical protein